MHAAILRNLNTHAYMRKCTHIYIYISTDVTSLTACPFYILWYPPSQPYLPRGAHGKPGLLGPRRAAMALHHARALATILMALIVAVMGPSASAPRYPPSIVLHILQWLADG